MIENKIQLSFYGPKHVSFTTDKILTYSLFWTYLLIGSTWWHTNSRIFLISHQALVFFGRAVLKHLQQYLSVTNTAEFKGTTSAEITFFFSASFWPNYLFIMLFLLITCASFFYCVSSLNPLFAMFLFFFVIPKQFSLILWSLKYQVS